MNDSNEKILEGEFLEGCIEVYHLIEKEYDETEIIIKSGFCIYTTDNEIRCRDMSDNDRMSKYCPNLKDLEKNTIHLFKI